MSEACNKMIYGTIVTYYFISWKHVFVALVCCIAAGSLTFLTMLYAWGANSHGQLGLGHKSEQCETPVLVQFHADVVAVCGGGGHTLVLDRSGQIHSCGLNSEGQLGRGGDGSLFQSVCMDNAARQIACGWDFSLAVTHDGDLYSWGSNRYGQLGVGNTVQRSDRPVKVPLCDVVRVAAGLRHAAAVTSRGDLYVWGSGRKGQLGIAQNEVPLPIKGCICIYENVVDTFPCERVVKSSLLDSHYHTWRQQEQVEMSLGNILIYADMRNLVYNLNGKKPLLVSKLSYSSIKTQESVSSVEGILHVACGQHHTLAVTCDDEIHAWGSNNYRQSGVPPLAPHDVKDLKSGWNHGVILTRNGQVVTWGRNNFGQLGRDGDPASPMLIQAQSGIREIAVGSEHNVALTESGTVLTWGWNEHGNCGTGDTMNVLRPTRICRIGKIVGCGAGTSFLAT